MRGLVVSSMLLLVIAGNAFALKTPVRQSVGTTQPPKSLAGRWRVKFTLAGVEKNLVLVAADKGVASFLFLDAQPDEKRVAEPLPGAWSQLTNDRVSFSGDAELPIGTCCREIGTLIFKGKLISLNSISGKVIFVTSVEDEEDPFKFRSLMGIFTAARIPK